ncbi:hypothetical protein [Mesorhizobium sp. BH1-1-4]|uniref:hypothetical protein n=1 Tax=Mesorhizobium sp. BH1-1-4 TaxID=2876662 RepID=UPI001CD139DF|nr:hypothetical protein [Mesorhizobium sp. BH1-1-4]MBZ9996913.1 hypothetical protein [Mesorhizobium sp. BH1-1-4]
MTKASLHLLKGVGYLISTLSVVLLAIVSWSSASKSPLLTICLLFGAAASIVGMFCRWLTYEIENRQEGKRGVHGGHEVRRTWRRVSRLSSGRGPQD